MWSSLLLIKLLINLLRRLHPCLQYCLYSTPSTYFSDQYSLRVISFSSSAISYIDPISKSSPSIFLLPKSAGIPLPTTTLCLKTFAVIYSQLRLPPTESSLALLSCIYSIASLIFIALFSNIPTIVTSKFISCSTVNSSSINSETAIILSSSLHLLLISFKMLYDPDLGSSGNARAKF